MSAIGPSLGLQKRQPSNREWRPEGPKSREEILADKRAWRAKKAKEKGRLTREGLSHPGPPPKPFCVKFWGRIAEANALKAFRQWRRQNPLPKAERDEAAYYQARKAADPEGMRWRERQARAKRRAKLKGAVTLQMDSSVYHRLVTQAVHCAYCAGILTKGVHGSKALPTTAVIDHVIPLAKGGAHDEFNLAVCCWACNSAKRSMMPAVWAARLEPDMAARVVEIGRRAITKSRINSERASAAVRSVVLHAEACTPV
ncbi:MAG TPA: HNH endonuclease [Geminicoccus sp.]|uniref:HNH endonuclease n=1 Tax=Geminicoccus sp. TaxID=2024832 RepID=UPI002BB9BD30|nr:HNH endonuclease [Geminicoccus sp.]HWL70416.1 HNH endonuclease [Geminicoccus sp.]